MTGTYGPKYKRLMPCATRTIIGKISVEPHILIMHPVSLIMYPPYCLPRQWQIDLFTVYDVILAGGANTAKITVKVWPTWNRYNTATKRWISNICHFFK